MNTDRKPLGPWGVNINDGPPSYGENKTTPGCKCLPSNVLYWELSEAITDNCPIHGKELSVKRLEES